MLSEINISLGWAGQGGDGRNLEKQLTVVLQNKYYRYWNCQFHQNGGALQNDLALANITCWKECEGADHSLEADQEAEKPTRTQGWVYKLQGSLLVTNFYPLGPISS